MSSAALHFERLPDVAAIEIVLPARGLEAHVELRWRCAAGAAIDVDGRPAALHFAPGRWLVDAVSGVDIADVATTGAALVDVDGRWTRFAFRGAAGRRILASATALDGLLDGRRCAATFLFDCPALVASVPSAPGGEWLIHVAASYAASFAAACERAATDQERMS